MATTRLDFDMIKKKLIRSLLFFTPEICRIVRGGRTGAPPEPLPPLAPENSLRTASLRQEKPRDRQPARDIQEDWG